MASAGDKKEISTEENDELEGLFETFDHQFKDLQQKFCDMERTLKEFRSNAASEDEANPDS
jgi:hypothetical protein